MGSEGLQTEGLLDKFETSANVIIPFYYYNEQQQWQFSDVRSTEQPILRIEGLCGYKDI